MTEPKQLRVFFNSRAEAPLVWSVDEWGQPGTERKVKAVHIMVSSITVFHDGPGEPRAWIHCLGRLVVSDTLEAYIFQADWSVA